jgi:hypothetical protein
MDSAAREWSDREVRDFNRLSHPDPHLRQLPNHWPQTTSAYFVLRWNREGEVAKSASHFCSGLAHWRADVFRSAGYDAHVETRYIAQGERYALVDGRTRPGCVCENCRLRLDELLPLPKPPKISAARARRLARGG